MLAGKPVCGGEMCGIVWKLPQDAEYAVNELKWPHYNSNKVCGYCPEGREEINVRDFSTNAPFKANLFQPGPTDTVVSSHRIWQIPGVSRFSYTPDEMHCSALGPLLALHAGTMHALIDATNGVFKAGALAKRISDL